MKQRGGGAAALRMVGFRSSGKTEERHGLEGQRQTPKRHCWPPVQAVPHLPQLVLLKLRKTQAPVPPSVAPQRVWPKPQTQAPAVQNWLLPHARPQVPQLAALVWTLVQVVPQSS